MGYGVVGVKKSVVRLIDMGVARFKSTESHYLRLAHIFDRTRELIQMHLPDEMAIEAPFFGKNVQSMLKLGRAQGVAMVAAVTRDIPITEYEPRKIKQSITGNGDASKEQVREMLRRTMRISDERLQALPLDATDALAAAMCHYYETSRTIKLNHHDSWKDFVAHNPDRIIE